MQRGLFFCLFFFLAASAGAQQRQKIEVFGGYQYEYFSDGFTKLGGGGWDASLAYHFAPWIGAKADFSGAYATDRSATTPAPIRNYTYTFGPELSLPKPRGFNLFGEVLLGRFRQSLGDGYNTSYGGFALLAGGGIDIKIHEHAALRLGEIDYFHLHPTQFRPLARSNNLRFSTGIVFPF